MPRGTSAKHATVTAPNRSANAARAYAAGNVTSTIDLAYPPVRASQRAASAANRSGLALGVVAAVVWVYDIARIAGH